MGVKQNVSCGALAAMFEKVKSGSKNIYYFLTVFLIALFRPVCFYLGVATHEWLDAIVPYPCVDVVAVISRRSQGAARVSKESR
jgi:hypothetical protein